LLRYIVSNPSFPITLVDIILSGWDIHDVTYSRELLISNKANGYRDIIAKVDLSTYRRIPWEYNVPFFLVSFLDPDTEKPICACPRGTLTKAIESASEHGWDCLAGVEYEVRISLATLTEH
jgi:glutamine synthetase